MSVRLWALVSATVESAGVSVIAAYGPMLGGVIMNPLEPEDQGLPSSANLYVSLVGPAGTSTDQGTFALLPGQMYRVPPNFAGNISINSLSDGHTVSGFVIQVPPDYRPFDGDFPPTGPTTMTQVIPSYLYEQYTDDDNLQAFVQVFNEMAQQYVAWFAQAMLPVYFNNPMLSGPLLDWVGEGLYGMRRPVLPLGQTQNLGMYNTIQFNTLPFNVEDIIGPQEFYLTTDDVYKRVLTWHLFKGDGKLFNVRWLKRRIARFLTGEDGGPGQTDQTYYISVTFGAGNQVDINLQSTIRTANGGAIYGAGMFNDFMFDEFDTTAVHFPVSPLAPIFKAAVNAGVLELPFQYDWVVNLN